MQAIVLRSTMEESEFGVVEEGSFQQRETVIQSSPRLADGDRASQWIQWALIYDEKRADSVIAYDAMVASNFDQLCEADLEQIEKDVHRTYPEIEGFTKPECLDRLQRILSAVAVNNEGGYAQAMNYVVGVVMIQLQDAKGIREGDIFWLSMVVFHLLPRYHDCNLTGAQVDSRVLSELLTMKHQACARAFDQMGVTPDLFFVEWLLGVMTSACPVSTVTTVFDLLLQHGRNSLLRACIAIMAWCHERLEPGACLMEIKHISMQCGVEDMATILLSCSAHDAPDEMIAKLQAKYEAAIRREVGERKVRDEVRQLKATTTITLDQAKAIRRQLLHQNDTGELNVDEFSQLLTKLFPHHELPEETAALFFAAFDADSSCSLDITEILRGLALCSSRNLADFVVNMFTVFDADNNGHLAPGEVKTMVQWLYFVSYSKPPSALETEKWVETMFIAMDSNGNGMLEKEELLKAYMTVPLIMECFVATPKMEESKHRRGTSVEEDVRFKNQDDNGQGCVCVIQ